MECYLQLGGWETTKSKLHHSKSAKINERGTKYAPCARTDKSCADTFFIVGFF